MIRKFGKQTIDICARIGVSGIFLSRTMCRVPKVRKSFPLLVSELFSVGVLSIPIIAVSAMFIGMVISLQGYNILIKFSAQEELGQLLSLSIVRELGPVITALLFAGRAGSALTAEIGLMKTTEQLSSMEMMGVDPLWRVISPRLWAGLISMPMLNILFCAIAVFGGYLVGVEWLGVDDGSFWSNMKASVDFRIDVVNGIIKSAVFGVVVTWIAVYQGFAAFPTAEGVSRATTRTVVYSSLMILGLDFVLTAVMMGGW